MFPHRLASNVLRLLLRSQHLSQPGRENSDRALRLPLRTETKHPNVKNSQVVPYARPKPVLANERHENR